MNTTDYIPAWTPRKRAPAKAEPARMGTAKVGAFVDHIPAPRIERRGESEVVQLSREVAALGEAVRDTIRLMSDAIVNRAEPAAPVIHFSPTIQPSSVPVSVTNEVAAPAAPIINMQVPEAAAPIIRVEAIAPASAPPQVTVVNQVQPPQVAPTPVTVVNEISVPKQEAPIINLPATPVTVRVEASEEFTTTEVTERDVTGRLLRTQTHRVRQFESDVQPEAPQE